MAQELARGCASTGWVYINLAVHHWMLAMWPPEGQDTVWDKNPDALIASSVIYPAERAVQAQGGYRLSGRWPFCSGINHSEWIMVGAMVEGAGPEGGPEARVFLVETGDLKVHDNWDVMGLCATGSVDSECEELFVPAYMTLAANATRGDRTPGTDANPSPVFRQSVGGLFPHMISTVLLGIARGMWDVGVESLRERSARQSGRKVAELVPVQNQVAEAGALIDAGPLQRPMRDLTAGQTHAHISWEINGPAHGRVALGLETDNPLI